MWVALMFMLCENVNGTFFLSRSQSLVRVILCQLYDLPPPWIYMPGSPFFLACFFLSYFILLSMFRFSHSSALRNSLLFNHNQMVRISLPPGVAQTQAHWVSDAIQPSHPVTLFPPALKLSQYQGLLQWVSISHQVAKVLEHQLRHHSFQWIFMVDFL